MRAEEPRQGRECFDCLVCCMARRSGDEGRAFGSGTLVKFALGTKQHYVRIARDMFVRGNINVFLGVRLEQIPYHCDKYRGYLNKGSITPSQTSQVNICLWLAIVAPGLLAHESVDDVFSPQRYALIAAVDWVASCRQRCYRPRCVQHPSMRLPRDPCS